MPSAYDFPGGIYPPERKQRSSQATLIEAPLPSWVTLPLQQHSGQPATPCVARGDSVKVGSVIANREGMISSNLHASISGTVTEVTTAQITIEGDGLDEWFRLPSLDWRSAGRQELLERLNESGIVGLGGAGFPSHIKARVVERHAIDTLVINAAECEPYITADDLTLRHYPGEVIEGAQIIAKLCDAQHIVIGIEDNKPEAIEALQQALADSQPVPVELTVIPTRYPSGGERQLIKKLLDLNVPSGGLPADVGVLCHNPGTLLAIRHAVRDGQPLVSRIVTLTGEAIAQPGNRWVRLGTSVMELLEEAGVNHSALNQVIQGGPMMGKSLLTLDTPVTKLTNCLIAATLDELPPPPAEAPCIRCGECENVCPVALLPQQLHWYARAQDDTKLERYHLFDCIECGACSYVCPSHIPLVVDYREAKSRIRLQRIEATKAEHAKHRFEFRQARLAREEAEKQARKQARQAQQRRPSNTVTPSTSSDKVDLRGLRIAHAAAKASVKKAEKTLARVAQEDPKQSLDDLEMQLATAQENLKAAELQLAQAREEQSSEESP
ncbi:MULTISPECIES: electron transport complex subunit RsxC [unclassified Halomonas]|uniref:electron transport complex subunit RsxC n=1 Tax=unclassified Halomonas TaxID=2609666 RepID=UPI0007D9468E|nr:MULTISPECIES: electron transport complex subunit RsxC [unclassified Halomonas]MBT2788117.1 electron transport complex subunit RsxC [Halomonas sp. ISL-106]MBT2795866.1 electron transport complex subunit RsxC [Halomonas sp. ISL-104]OAL61149.1 electron transporter RnfC [Halomonas sp. ALS9]